MNRINQNWVFGEGAGLNFSAATPTAQSGFSIHTEEGCASVSDQNGSLLFYTDGRTVWDNLNVPRITGLLGNTSSTQSAIIIPNPASEGQYYIFTADGVTGGNNHLSANLIDTSATVWTNTIVALAPTVGFSPTERVTAIQHRNCKDYWVITVLQATNTVNAGEGLGVFRVFSVNSSGVSHLADTPITNLRVHDGGYLKCSPNVERIAFANWSRQRVHMFPIDNSTGVIDVAGITTYAVPIALLPPGHPGNPYGLEFSPNSEVLYYSVLGNELNDDASKGFVFQVDLNTQAQVLVAEHKNIGGEYAIGALQLAMNGIIYMAQDMESMLGTISNPNVIGPGCNASFNQIALSTNPLTRCRLGLPNLLPNPCEHDGPCDCGCTGCNEDAEAQNEELIDRAKSKFNIIKSRSTCADPFGENCDTTAINSQVSLEPCFYFHWGDGSNDQIEEHDTEVFYLTVCNPFNDIQFNGLRITKITLNPDIHPIDKIHIVPDRFISLDCIEPCTCQTREFAMITRANDTAGAYTMEVEYCFDNITLASGGNKGKAIFDLEITED